MSGQPANNLPARRGSRWRIVGWSLAAFLLLLPLLAMQVTDEVAWDETDFIVFGAMLATAGGALELAARARSPAYRVAVALAVLAIFLLLWISLAVGIIGEGGRADLIYLAVPAVLLIGAAMARFQAAGMARALFATALAQAAAGGIAVLAGLAPVGATLQILGLTGMFVVLFLGSALLFRRAAGARPRGAAS